MYLHGFSNPFHALQVFSDASDVLSRYTHVYSSCNYYSNYIKYNFYLCKRKYKMNRRLTKIFTGFLEVSWGCVSKRALRVLQVVFRYLVKYCHKCTCSSRYLGCLGGPLRVFRSMYLGDTLGMLGKFFGLPVDTCGKLSQAHLFRRVPWIL